jgi:type I restriction enzyme S subunit
MSSEWPILKIEDIAERVGMGPFGSSIKVETFVESGVPVVSGEHLHDITLTEKKFRFITEQHATQLAKSNVFRGDVVFTHAGTIGQVSVIPEDSKYEKYILSQRQFFMRCNRELVNPLYVAYFFKSPQGRHKLLANASQVGVPSIARPVTYLRSIEISVPPLPIQNRIVSVIESIRDRITLLRETNATLEATAQALFKSWFVDFDPVHAKSEGKLPDGMDAATAALFPDAFEETELGRVPRGWNITSVEEVAERVGMGPFGSNIKVETFVKSGIPVISGQHLKQTLVEDNTFNFITVEHAQKLSKSCVQAGDIIFTHAGSIGQVSLLHKDAAYPLYVLSQRQFFLRCKVNLVSPDWMVQYFKTPQGQHQLLANTSQVGVPSIARPVSYLKSIKLVIPSPEINRVFSDIAGNIHTSLITNQKRMNTLALLRDTLLPRLISGKLRIADAEAEFEKVTA